MKKIPKFKLDEEYVDHPYWNGGFYQTNVSFDDGTEFSIHKPISDVTLNDLRDGYLRNRFNFWWGENKSNIREREEKKFKNGYSKLEFSHFSTLANFTKIPVKSKFKAKKIVKNRIVDDGTLKKLDIQLSSIDKIDKVMISSPNSRFSKRYKGSNILDEIRKSDKLR